MSARASRLKPDERPAWSRAQLVATRAQLLQNALALRSKSAYGAAFRSYMRFCEIHNFSLQPTTDTLTFYIAYMSSYVQPHTVATYLSGIIFHLQEIFPETRQVRESWLVKRTLQGALRLRSLPVKRKRHLVPSDLDAAIASVHADPNYDRILFCAMLFVGFHGLLRTSELTLTDDESLQDYRRVMMRTHLKKTAFGFSILLSGHKADQSHLGNDVILAARDDPLDPRTPLLAYLVLRDSNFPLSPFLWLRANGDVPTYSWFTSTLKSVLGEDFGGSSMRSGGATWLSASGSSDDDIRRAGRWSSEAYERYLRAHPLILHARLWRNNNPSS